MITLTYHGEQTIEIEEDSPILKKYLILGWTIKN